MIYIKQLNRLFASHRMEVPNRFNYVTPYDEADWYRDVEAYKIWRASETKVVGNPKWVDGQEVIEGVDYRIEKKHTYWNEVKAKNVTVPTYAIPIENNSSVANFCDKYKDEITQLVNQPLSGNEESKEPETPKKGIDLEELEKRFDAFFANETEQTLKAWLKKKRYVKTDDLVGVKEEGLLKPRYKVIADYPRAVREVGYVINDFHSRMISFYDKYPHLFKKLEWWEERASDEMPQYLKSIKHGHFIYVQEWCGFNVKDVPIFEFRISQKHPETRGLAYEWLPATKEEYDYFMLNKVREEDSLASDKDTSKDK